MLDLVASRRHYLDHLLPVWRVLPPEVRGDVYLDPSFLGVIPGARPLTAIGAIDRLTLVAAGDDLNRCAGRRVVLMEHGIGQSYGGDPDDPISRNPAYAGGEGRHNVSLFLAPNPTAAARDQERYPHARVEVVGSPILAGRQALLPAPPSDPPTVALTWHWDLTACPETRSSWGYWSDAVHALATSGEFTLLGHAHPRMFRDLAPTYKEWGIEPVADFDQLLTRAHVLVADNTSAMYEWALLRGPVVVLDSPWYRRKVEHGLRFWSAADIGPRIEDPKLLPVAIQSALTQVPWPKAAEALAQVYPPVEDPAGTAAAAILDLLAGKDSTPRRSTTKFPRVAVHP